MRRDEVLHLDLLLREIIRAIHVGVLDWPVVAVDEIEEGVGILCVLEGVSRLGEVLELVRWLVEPVVVRVGGLVEVVVPHHSPQAWMRCAGVPGRGPPPPRAR